MNIINTKLKLDENKNFKVSAIYRSHSLPILEFISSLEDFLKTKRNITNNCIVGDYNIDILSQDTINIEFLSNL